MALDAAIDRDGGVTAAAQAEADPAASQARASLRGWLDAPLAARGSALDAAQVAAAERLQRLSDELHTFKAARASRIRRLFVRPDLPRGVYLWGGVGRGKSLLMDAFYATVPIRRKTRVHFHAFMRDVHEALKALVREADPLASVAAGLARRYRLVCFDEFHVSDIADAMILGRLLSALFERGVVLVATSNYAPAGLYPDGLQRQNFMPTIALLERTLDVVEVDGGTDYRLRALEQAPAYHVPAGEAADRAMARAFDALATGPDEGTTLHVEGREVAARRRAGSAVWFDFAALCGGPRSQRDYLELARTFAVVFVSCVPRMGAATADQARRFTWLVDILYDHRVKLVLSAAVPAEELYVEGPNAREFARTVSRLAEMRTHDYMALPHASEEAPTRHEP